MSTRAARWMLFSTVFLPFVLYRGVIFPYITTRALLFRAVVGLVALLLLWQLLTREVELADARDPVLWGLGAWLGAGLLSAVLGVATHHSLYGDMERMWALTQWAHLLLFYGLVRVYFDGEWWTKFLRASLLVSVAVALYAAGQFAFATWQEALLGIPRVRGVPTEYASTLGNPGYLAIYGIVHWAAVGALWGRTASVGWRIFYAVAAAANAVSLLLAGSRAAYVGAAAGAVVAVALLARHAWRERGGLPWRALGWTAGGAAAAVLALWVTGALGAVAGATGLRGLVELPGSLGSGTMEARLVAWEAAFEAFRARPITGWGVENFHLVWDRFADPELYRIGMPENWDRAHNAFVGALAEAGAVGAAAYVGLWAAVAWQAARVWRERALGTVGSAALVGAVGAWLVFLCFWFEDLNAFFLLLALLALGRWRLAGETPLVRIGSYRPATAAKRRWLRRGLAVAVLVVGAGLLWRAGATAGAARELVGASAARSVEDATEHYEEARGYLSAQDRTVATEYAGFVYRWGTGAAGALRQGVTREVFGTALTGAERVLEPRIADAPTDVRLLSSRASLALGAYAGLGAEEAFRIADRALERAVEIAPNRLALYQELASYRQAAGRIPAAREAIDRALARYDRYGEIHYLRSQIEATAGEWEAAVRWLRRAYWLGHVPVPQEYALALTRRLAARGEHALAASVGTHYFAARHLEAGWRAFPDDGRAAFLADRGLSAEIAGYRGYGLGGAQLLFLREWTEHLCRAGFPDRARLAARLVGNGLPPRYAGPFIAGAGRCGEASGGGPER